MADCCPAISLHQLVSVALRSFIIWNNQGSTIISSRRFSNARYEPTLVRKLDDARHFYLVDDYCLGIALFRI